MNRPSPHFQPDEIMFFVPVSSGSRLSVRCPSFGLCTHSESCRWGSTDLHYCCTLTYFSTPEIVSWYFCLFIVMEAPGASVDGLSYKSGNELYKILCRCIIIKWMILKVFVSYFRTKCPAQDIQFQLFSLHYLYNNVLIMHILVQWKSVRLI